MKQQHYLYNYCCKLLFLKTRKRKVAILRRFILYSVFINSSFYTSTCSQFNEQIRASCYKAKLSTSHSYKITIQSGSREVTSSSDYTQLPFVNNNYWIECRVYAIYSRMFHTDIITDTSLQKMSYTYCSYSL